MREQQTQKHNLPAHRPSKAARGFTILELLVVISIMAVLATLATGAAIKAVKQMREKRVDATVKALEMALVSYRAQENAWPFKIDEDLKIDTEDRTEDPSGMSDKNKKRWADGVDNVKAFKKLYENASKSDATVYLDASAILTDVRGKRMTLRAALNAGVAEAPLGYPMPDNPNRFCYFCVCYSPLTDSVSVFRQDRKHVRTDKNGNAQEFWCPVWTVK